MNAMLVRGDAKARPFGFEDFRDMLGRVGRLSDVMALRVYQINHVRTVTSRSVEATKKILTTGDQEVKGRRCLVVDTRAGR